MSGTRGKIDLYILSLGLLFVFITIMTIKLPAGVFQISTLAELNALLQTNLIPLLTIFLFIYCFVAYAKFQHKLKGAPDIPFEITEIEGINYEHLTFLATYVVPLISFDFDSGRQMAVLALLLVVMGIIYIKTDLFYANPSLALLGFHIYRVDGNFKNDRRKGIIVICREKFAVGDRAAYIKLDDRIYYAKGVRNDRR
jgi:hypothetical protein